MDAAHAVVFDQSRIEQRMMETSKTRNFLLLFFSDPDHRYTATTWWQSHDPEHKEKEEEGERSSLSLALLTRQYRLAAGVRDLLGQEAAKHTNWSVITQSFVARLSCFPFFFLSLDLDPQSVAASRWMESSPGHRKGKKKVEACTWIQRPDFIRHCVVAERESLDSSKCSRFL